MASQGPSTRVQPPSPPPAPASEAGLDISTLFLSAIASAAAAYVTSKLWARGTLISAAMSPVIVALVKEGLRKPTEVVTAAVPVRGRVRTRSEALPGDLTDDLVAGAPPPFPPPQPGAAEGPVRVYSTRDRRRRLRWRLAVLTGLLGFATCVVLYTVPELLAGQSVGSSGRATTLWGGGTSHRSSSTKTTTTPAQSTGATTTTTTTTPAQTSPAAPTSAQPPAQTTPSQTTPAATTPAAPPADTTPATPPAPAAPQTTTPATP
jgi:hypothetical protein